MMTAVFSPSGSCVASRGMDNMLTIYHLNFLNDNGLGKILRARFPDDENVIRGKLSLPYASSDLY